MNQTLLTRSLIVLGAVAAILLLVETALRFGRPIDTVVKRDVVDIQSPAILRAKLRAFERHDGVRIALLGDSVPYGRSMLEHGDKDWRDHTLDRVIERELKETTGRDDIYVANFGMNGAVPQDIERVAAEVIAAGADLIIVDTNLRSYSRDFAGEDTRWSRPWLETFSREGALPAVERVWLTYGLAEFFQWRWLNAAPREAAAQALANLNQALGYGPERERPLTLALKARARYATADLAADNPQRQALQGALQQAHDADVGVVVFYATEKPGLIDQIMAAEKRQPLLNALEQAIKSVSDDIAYIPPQTDISPDRFLDQVHLDAEGYEIVGARIASAAVSLLEDKPQPSLSPPPSPSIASNTHMHVSLSWFGDIDPYHRGGVMEIYGLIYDPVKSGPVGVSANMFTALEENSLVAWGGRDFRGIEADVLRLSFDCGAGVPAAFRVGALLENGDVIDFRMGKEPQGAYTRTDALPNLTPTAFEPLTQAPAASIELAASGCGTFEAKVPEQLRKALRGEAAIAHLFFQAPGLEAGGQFSIAELAFLARDEFDGVIRGRLTGGAAQGKVILLDASGERAEAELDDEGAFSFRAAPEAHVSVFYEPDGLASDLRFSDQGRWFAAGEGRSLVIDNGARFTPDGPNDLAPPRREQFPALFNRKRTLELIGSGFPHQRYTYMGRGGDPREWETYTFTNHKGFFDKDRVFGRESDCLRIAIAGGSNVTTIMHHLSDKANLRLEAELGVALGRCVEVIAAGMGAGNTAAYLAKAKDYLGDARLDYLFLELHPETMFASHPEIAKTLSGIDPDYPQYDTLYYDADGALEWRRRTPEHRKHLSEVDKGEEAALQESLRALLSEAPDTVKEAYDLAFDIVEHAGEEFPNTTVVPFAYRQVPIAQAEARSALGDDARPSIAGFKSNIEKMCAMRRAPCFITPYDERLSNPETDLLTWVHDNHHNHFGIDYFVRTFSEWFIDFHERRIDTPTRGQRLTALYPTLNFLAMNADERRSVLAFTRGDDDRPTLNITSFKEPGIVIGDALAPLTDACPATTFTIRRTGTGEVEGYTEENFALSADALRRAKAVGVGRIMRLVLSAQDGACPLLPLVVLVRNENERSRFNAWIEHELTDGALSGVASPARRAALLTPMCEDVLAGYDRMLSDLQGRGWKVRPVEEAIGAAASDKKFINMRHDVHPRDVAGSICKSYLESKYGFLGSYQILKQYTSWEARNADKYKLFAEYVAPGHPLSFHAEPVGRYYAARCDGPDSTQYGEETKACIADEATVFLGMISDYVSGLDDAARSDVRAALMVNALNCPATDMLAAIAPKAMAPIYADVAALMRRDIAAFSDAFGAPPGASVHGGAFHHNVRRACMRTADLDPLACDLAARLTSIGGFPFEQGGSPRSADVDRCEKRRVFVSDGAHPQRFQATLNAAMRPGKDIDVLTHANVWVTRLSDWR